QCGSFRVGRLRTRRPGTALTRPTEDHLSQRLHDQRPGTALTRLIENRLLARGSAAAHGKRNVFPERVNAAYFFSSYVAVYLDDSARRFRETDETTTRA